MVQGLIGAMNAKICIFVPLPKVHGAGAERIGGAAMHPNPALQFNHRRPLLHHAPALGKMRCPVVGTPVRWRRRAIPRPLASARRFVTCFAWQCGRALRRDLYKSPLSLVICENDRGKSWYVCGQARYVREPQLRAPSPLYARRVRDDGPPDGDDARRRGGERRHCGDARRPDASVTVPFMLLLPESEQS